MAAKIGFGIGKIGHNDASIDMGLNSAEVTARKSVVEVYFSERNRAFAYFNDRFDLYKGDLVYVDGKLEGLVGKVTEVNYNFKINPSDYKRVISRVDTEVHGKLCFADSHFLPLSAP